MLEDKYGEVTTIEIDGKSASASGVIATIIDNGLPPSFRRGESATVFFMMDLHSLTKRQLRQRILALMTQLANMPKTIDEQLAARKHAANVRGMISEGFEKLACDLAEKQASAGRTPASRTKG